MARTIKEISDSIIGEMQVNIPALTSPSKVAIYRLIVDVVATAIWSLEKLWDIFKADIETRIQAAVSGTVAWLHNACLTFQYGDNLEFNGEKFIYPVVNTDKQIIKRCAIVESGSKVLIKVAKLSGETPVELTFDEYNAFKWYIRNIKFAGVKTAIISQPADLLSLSFKVYYAPTLLSSSGELINEPGTYPVVDAINNYIAGIVFNGKFNITSAIDAIQQAIGVVEPIAVSAQGKEYNAANYISFSEKYYSVAGYMVIDNLNIEYISNV